jgi:hypothetical protein
MLFDSLPPLVVSEATGGWGNEGVCLCLIHSVEDVCGGEIKGDLLWFASAASLEARVRSRVTPGPRQTFNKIAFTHTCLKRVQTK